MTTHRQPPGYVDMESDAEFAPSSPHYQDLDVPEVGIVRARKPMPNAVASLGAAAKADIDIASRIDYLMLFLRNHVEEGEQERLLHDMGMDLIPADSIERVARAIATWGTARPTQPS